MLHSQAILRNLLCSDDKAGKQGIYPSFQIQSRCHKKFKIRYQWLLKKIYALNVFKNIIQWQKTESARDSERLKQTNVKSQPPLLLNIHRHKYCRQFPIELLIKNCKRWRRNISPCNELSILVKANFNYQDYERWSDIKHKWWRVLLSFFVAFFGGDRVFWTRNAHTRDMFSLGGKLILSSLVDPPRNILLVCFQNHEYL